MSPEKIVDISSDFEEDEAYLEIRVQKARHTFVLNKNELMALIDDLEDTLSLMK